MSPRLAIVLFVVVALVRKYAQVMQRYFVQYLSKFDVTSLRNSVQVQSCMSPCLWEVCPFISSFCICCVLENCCLPWRWKFVAHLFHWDNAEPKCQARQAYYDLHPVWWRDVLFRMTVDARAEFDLRGFRLDWCRFQVSFCWFSWFCFWVWLSSCSLLLVLPVPNTSRHRPWDTFSPQVPQSLCDLELN